MTVPKSDMESEEIDDTEIDYSTWEDYYDEKLSGELKYSKKSHNWVYKVLKYNPIDPLNDLWRKFIDSINMTEKEKKVQWWLGYIYVKWLARTFWNFKARYPKGNMFPEYGAGILVSSHQSHLDPFFCGAACHRHIHWMSKLDNFKTPLVKTLFTNLSAFKLDRDNPKIGWEKAKALLRKGEWIGIFPEGTRSKDGSLGRFKSGAVRLAIENEVPIVPMAVVGSRDALPKGKLVMKPTQVITRVGDPIYYDEYDLNKMAYDEIRELTDELYEIVKALKDGTYGKEEEQELSIGSPEDIEKKPKKSFDFMSYIKDQGKAFIKLLDDSWYTVLKLLETFGVREEFQMPIYSFSGEFVHHWSQRMMPYKVFDYEKYLPKEGPAVLCTNHNSEWDVMLLATSIIHHYPRRKIYQMAKQSLFKIPIVNAWVRTHHAFPLKRDQHDVDSYNYAKDLLRKGEIVTVYPEGTTNSGDGQLLEGHTGAIRLAIEEEVPILLIGITGTENIYPKHAKIFEFYNGAVFKAGKPFMDHKKYWGKEVPEYDTLKELTNRMMERIADLLVYDNKNDY